MRTDKVFGEVKFATKFADWVGCDEILEHAVMKWKIVCCTMAAVMALAASVEAQVLRIWLTHQSTDPSGVVVSWETAKPGDSVVHYGLTAEHGRTVSKPGNRTLHHVEIPLAEKDVIYHYAVRTGDQVSESATFKGYPTDELRVAVVANWGYANPDLTALRRENIHLLLTAGDNVASLHQFCAAGVTNCTRAFSALIDREPELFRSTLFMPVLGNHDREIRPRGPKPPPEPVYDVAATAYREFFELPGDEWKWHFDVPEFDVRFIALDLNHISDLGTTWQTCHPFLPGSEQFEWYRDLMEMTRAGFVITLQNERNAAMRGQANGAWRQLFRKGSAVITGFGYYGERAEADGIPYYDISLNGRGNRYPDPQSKFLAGEDNYLLLTFRRDSGEMRIELKNLDGELLDGQSYPKRRVE
jgi:hypothetical protein